MIRVTEVEITVQARYRDPDHPSRVIDGSRFL
jgi:hypothetical protein